MGSSGNQFGLAYLDSGEVVNYLENNSGHVLGVIGFGRGDVQLPALACIPLRVHSPVRGAAARYEVWTSDAPVAACEYRGMRGTTDGKVLFSSLTLEQRAGDTLET